MPGGATPNAACRNTGTWLADSYNHGFRLMSGMVEETVGASDPIRRKAIEMSALSIGSQQKGVASFIISTSRSRAFEFAIPCGGQSRDATESKLKYLPHSSL